MNNSLRKSIQQILLAGSAATFAVGALAAVGQQNPPPGPGQIPDYFGVTPNYANSPQPILAQVVFNSHLKAGQNASAVPVSAGGIITGITKLVGGSGYLKPVVKITDQGLGTSAAADVVLAGGITGITIVNGSSECTNGAAVTFNDPLNPGNTTAQASVNVDGTGVVTGTNIINPGSGYSSGTTVSLLCDTTASGTVTVASGNPGEILGFIITNPGQSYSQSPTVTITDPLGSGTGATATATVDSTGVVTGVNIISPGSGYSAGTTVTIEDVATGTGATATAVATRVGRASGVITQINITSGGAGYRNPMLEISDANATGGSGAVAVATTYDYANDVQTDKIMDVQVLTPGSSYGNDTTVTINGGTGVAPVTLTPLIDNGTITGFNEIPSSTNPISGFTGLGSGFKTPVAGSGIRKFVDSLPGLDKTNNLGQQMPIAIPDTTTFVATTVTPSGSDYYEIAEVEYTQKLHSDLPTTHLRGYVQIKPDGFTIAGFNAAADKLAYASKYAGYLGPVIVAQKNKPVRVKLVNLLSIGNAGKLPVPVDHTYMGADGPTDTDNRTSMHLHGGNTPWISDGTARQWTKPKGETGPNKGESARNVPDMWFDANGDLIPNSGTCTQGTTNCTTAGATNSPGDGVLTFFFTNEQSARLMFYHDHAEGTTRLNVYAGMAGTYVIQDPAEQALIADGTLPGLADTIPLVIQEKTFVPDQTQPVLNFYGPFKSQLESQDPTWRWGTGTAATGLMGNGDLWVPHVFMPNQNPGDVSGANAVGRWDYGPWFWPPFANIQNQPLANPYYDAACDTTNTYCEGPQIPGVPNGSLTSVLSNGIPGGLADQSKGGAITESPSGTPEAFNDTPLVNGTVYPYIDVAPKKYRLRILSVANDRMLNLSLVVAASKNTDTTSLGNAGSASAASAKLCDGTTAESAHPADCTEVKMVPFDATQNKTGNTPFPGHWYTLQKGGVTFDGRPAGVFDPASRGPAMVQIGTEGGFLSSPVVIKNQPVNYEYNPKNILIGNIKEHALLLGPAERADVLVDFSNFAGSTVILYNDAGAPVPAWDLRLDYYTGNFDNTDTGGAFSVIPGYGPNSRTLMQFRVGTTGGSSSHPVDDLGNITMATLKPVIQNAFKTSQEHIIVPQSAYNSVYGISATDSIGSDLSSIFSTQLKYNPLSMDAMGHFSLLPGAVTLELEPKTIIEDWTMNWGRMNALLGTEVPRTTATIQTSIPLAFVDPPTDLVKITPNDNMVPVSGTLRDGTQLWKITHNGVDSHSVHFHLFHVQVVNRVGWDGAIYPPEANELGWKDTVLMHPLSDIIVAMRPMVMTALPFKVPNSHRLIDPALAKGAPSNDFFNLNPLTGNASDVTNQEVNYGWEYLWHCHILGHEENDMMRSIAVAQPPEKPVITSATGNGSITVTWTDNSVISNWFTIQRSTSPTFATIDASINVVQAECANQAGCRRTYIDTTAPKATSVYYRVMANNTVGAGDGKLDAPRNADGSYSASLPPELSTLTPGYAGFDNVTGNSEWSGTGSRLAIPVATVTGGPLTFGNQAVNIISTAKTVTLTNSGSGNMAIASIATSAPFARAGGTCAATLAPAASCTVTVTFTPTSTGTSNGTLTITDNSNNVAGNTQTVTLTGIGTAPVAAVTGALAFGNVNVGSTSTAKAVTLSNTGTGPLAIASIVAPTQFAQTNNCGASLAAGANCSINVTFKPTIAGAASGNLIITDNNNGVASSQQTVALSGTGQAVIPAAPGMPTTASVTATGLTLNWSAVTGATSYTVQRATVAAGPWTTISSAATNSLTVSGLSANTTYYLHVSATNSAGTSAYGTAKSQLTLPNAPTATAAVNGLTTDGTTRSGGVSWTAPAVGATSYQVQYANATTMASATTVTGTSGARITINIAPATSATRYMQVRAVNPSGNSAWTPVTPIAVTVQ